MGYAKMMRGTPTKANPTRFISCVGIFGLVCFPPLGVLFGIVGLIYRKDKEEWRKRIGLNIFIIISSIIMCIIWDNMFILY